MPDRSNTHFTPIRLIEDQPIDDLDRDYLGLMPWAKMIASAAVGTRGPFTIGVHGVWGYGKTTLLRLTQRLIEEHYPGVVTVWFNAWQFEREEHPTFPLIAAIAGEIEAKSECRKLRKAVIEVGAAVRGIARGAKFSGEVGVPGAAKLGLEVDAQKAIEEDRRILLEQTDPLHDLMVYREAFKTLEKVAAKAKKAEIVVFIDDLDRCHPDKAVHLLESVKLILSQPGFVFVMAVDRDLIERYLQKRYCEFCGETTTDLGRLYLDKIIQLPIEIPNHRSRFDAFVRDLISDIGKGDGGNRIQLEALRGVQNVLAIGAGNNPRSLVRLVNNFLLDCSLWPLIEREDEYNDLTSDVAAALAFNRILDRALGGLYNALIEDDELCAAIEGDTLERFPTEPSRKLPEETATGAPAGPETKDRRAALVRALLSRKELVDTLRHYGSRWLLDRSLREAVHEFSQTQRGQAVAADFPEPIADAIRDQLGLQAGEPIPADRLKEANYLDLSDTQVTDAGLVHIKGRTWLQTLKLSNTQVTDAGLVHIKGLTELLYLDLSNTQVTDAGLVHIKGLTALHYLMLSYAQVTNAGLGHLKSQTGLQWLTLKGTHVTDAGLVHLKGLTRLQHLYLSDTQVTDAGVEKLRNEIPGVTVHR